MTTLSKPADPPPDTDQHDGDDHGDGYGRVSVLWIDADDQAQDAGANLSGPAANDPDAWAAAVVRAARGLAHMLGPDHEWALAARLAPTDGGSGR